MNEYFHDSTMKHLINRLMPKTAGRSQKLQHPAPNVFPHLFYPE
jgi:hypothetical protein